MSILRMKNYYLLGVFMGLFGSQLCQAQAPAVTALNPTRNARSVSAATNVAITFSQPMSSGAATLGAMRVFSAQRGGQLRNGVGGSTSASGNTLTFNPTTNFRPGETLFTTITPQAQSMGGNSLARGQVYQFTTEVGGTGRGSFTAPTTNANPAVGRSPISVALGDVDGDGDLDLLSANFESDNVSVQLNDGTGSFTAPPTNPNPAVGDGPYSVVLGDVDGDGDLDFLTANLYSDNVSVRLNNGTGNFTPPATSPNPTVGDAPSCVVLGDVDGDGDLDFLTANVDNTVSVRLNDGTGRFTSPTTNPNPAVGNQLLSVVLGDLDGDGDLDFISCNASSSVSVRLNDGTGNFTPPATAPNPTVGTNIRSVALGDVDGDGDLDLLTANFSSNNVSVRLNNGTGRFSTSPTIPNPAVGDGPLSVVLGDVDGDGDLDFLTTNASSNNVSIRLNNGTGNFTPPSTNPNPGVGSRPYSVVLGDVDGDGDLDFLNANYSNNNVSVRLNGSTTPAPTITGFSVRPEPACAQMPITFTATVGNVTGSYNYTLTNGSSTTTGATSTSAFSETLLASGNGSQSFTLTVNNNGQTGRATTNVTVTPTEFTVANTNDAGAGSLRQAMLDVAATTCPGPFTITASAISGTINLASVLPAITKDVAFIGPGASSLTVRRNSGGTYRIFFVPNPNTVSFSGFTIADGLDTEGGGIYSSGILTLSNCFLVNNRTSTGGGGVFNSNQLTVNNCTFSGNQANDFGGGVYSSGSNMTIHSSLFMSNVAGASGQNAEGGGLVSFNPVAITNCLFVDNSTSSSGGGASLRDGSQLTNCTFTNNIGGGVSIFTNASTFLNTTITNSSAGFGLRTGGSGPVLRNCLIAGNLSGDILASVAASSSYNVVGTESGSGLTNGVNNNKVGVNPLLAPLGDYGGPRQTHALLPGSPAINAGTAMGAPTTDDRGISRVDATDIGSFESRGFTMALSGGNGQSATVNSTFANPLVVTVSSANNEPVAGGVVTFTGPGSGASINPASGTASIGTTTASRSVTANARTGGAYTVSATANGASPTIQFALTNTATAPTISGFTTVDNTVCVGNLITFTATVGTVTGSYAYTLTNGSGTSITGNTSNTALSQELIATGTGPQTFTLCINANSQTTTATTDVTVNSLPTPSLTNNGPLSCTLRSVTLTASGGDSYTFASPDGTVLAGSGNMRSVTASGIYSVTVATTSTGCVSTTTTTVISNTATITVTNPTTTTANTVTAFNQTFTASGGVTPHSFSIASGSLPTGLSLSTNGVLSGISTQNGSFTLTVQATDANGCSGTGASYELTVADPTPAISNFIADPDPLCQGSLVTFTASLGNVTGTYTYTLTNGIVDSPTGTTTGSGTGASFSQVMRANDAGFPTYTLTIHSNGQLASETFVLSVAERPTASLLADNEAILSCNQPTLQLTARGGDQYQFSGPGIVSQDVTEDQEQWIGVAVVNQAGVYSVTVGAGEIGCYSVASLTITEDTSLASVHISPTSATLTCANPSATLTANGTGTYLWSTGATSQTITATSAGTYSVTLTALNGCKSFASALIEQGADQTIGISQQPASASLVTVGSPVSTQVVITGPVSAFQWYKDNLSQPLASQTSAQLTLTNVQPSDAGSYFVVASGPCNSLTSTAFSLSVTNPVTSLSLTASVSPNPNQVGQFATITASVLGGAPPYSYTFSGPGTITPAGDIATVSGLSAGVYRFTVIASDATQPTPQQATSVVSLTVNALESAPFAITGVTTISCSPITPNRFSVSFTPRYSGLNGQPISFSVANEMLPTTQAGPYTLQLYTDNATITLQASQQGTPTPISFSYNWLEACRTSENPNTPPRVVTRIPAQTAKVGDYLTYVIPENTFTDSETPLSLKLSANGLPAGLSFAGATLSGTPSTTVGSPFTVSITATDPGGLSVSTPLVITVLPATTPVEPTTPFAITGVTTISCTPIANRINISFAPQYVGLNAQPIAFEIVNERAPTTDPAPYSLTLYRDNPVITLRARQTGSEEVASFRYNWLAACSTAGQDNTPPRINSPVGSQTATVGKAFNLNVANTFADQETPNQLTLTASGLPAGLILQGTAISGTPSVSGVSSVTLTATDGGGLSNNTSFALTVSPAQSTTTTPPAGFTITGVETVSCERVGAGQRRVSFTPQYSGVNGQSINFRVQNELAATTAAGPYSLNLYTDNPSITLKATQSGSGGEVSYRYNWLAACSAPARLGTGEPEQSLKVSVLGNPVEGKQVELEIQDVAGQGVWVQLVDQQGKSVSQQHIEQAGLVERVHLPVGTNRGILLLSVQTLRQQHQQKIVVK